MCQVTLLWNLSILMYTIYIQKEKDPLSKQEKKLWFNFETKY